jgi:DNA-binding transcriptional MerR regulator
MSKLWKIGELAKETGLTVRTLHHYDEIGLLVATSRSESDYRLYSPTDVERLQQILSLRQLGFTLKKIKELLDGSEFTIQEIVQMHLEKLQEQMELQESLTKKLRKLSIAISSQNDISSERLIKIIEVMAKMTEHGFNPKFSDEEKAQLDTRREEMGEEKIKEVEKEWPELIAKVRAEMAKGSAPSDPDVQKLAKRWNELVMMFTGGDKQVENKLNEAYEESPDFAASMGLDKELFEFIEQAMSDL